MMVGRIIETDACVAEGAAYLARLKPEFATALELTGPLPLRRKPDGFEPLLNAICGQQISVAAANAIWARLEKAGLTNAQAIRKASDDEIKACGMSRPKTRYTRALAAHDIDFVALRSLPNDQVVARLTEVVGIGRWTAEIYAMFSLGRADVFAPGDLALQEAAKTLFELPERPTEKAFSKLAQDWTPWRGVAARLLWAYYRVIKQREGIT
ncbi:MAG: DNA-3-methyladenine glycosylase 2 family protein [Rhodobacteraceae bacterium]|nr:DNA-3-methyladenine glycosylase 2 family protein [Paracoccaceae bacterium]